MNITINEGNDNTVLALEGRLDGNASGLLAQQLNETIDSGQPKVIVDFSQLVYISSAGLRVILIAAKLLKQSGGRIALCNANDQIQEVLEISGFQAIVKHLGSLDEAIECVCE